MQSCNGLFLCSSSLCNPRKVNYYIYNATTNQHSKLPPPHYKGDIVGVSLGFDPSKSPHYKVVCVSRNWNRSCCDFTYSSQYLYQIEISHLTKGLGGSQVLVFSLLLMVQNSTVGCFVMGLFIGLVVWREADCASKLMKSK